MSWESVVAYVQFQGKNLQSISLRPIAMNVIGEGQPDVHNEYASNQFLATRGLPSPATGARAGYILQRLADLSKPFGTKIEIKGDTAEIKIKGGTLAQEYAAPTRTSGRNPRIRHLRKPSGPSLAERSRATVK